MRFPLILAAAAVAAALAALPAHAADDIPGIAPGDYDVVMSKSFMNAHPDMLYRLRGLGALQRSEARQAESYFRHAARYADKLSQAFLAQMLWEGRGIPQDRALAYAWMDLAAERGSPMLIAERERYWAALDEAQRTRAVAEGKALYAKYADKVTQPRLETAMRRSRTQEVLGSHTGSVVSQIDLCVGDWRMKNYQLVCDKRVTADHFYQPRFWKPADYWKWQEQQIGAPKGEIQLGTPETVKQEGT
ncbi:hypothetical protein P6166_08625 [Stenotrophomonas sp. HITSZ_GD]|uniref:hypothetical protein n=1 Tax=Stenotrophomonas sp. HITSZ_GD TaxID=3037248 RepID=UPI00240D11C1|nr:hypothetical protein [Stenotrophomonas sp. HITSZ_GD]MDG2525415.1 hypothetical protein [Stenotrophomonas sp. HITSZ_GD]